MQIVQSHVRRTQLTELCEQVIPDSQPDMPPHIKQAKLLKQASNDKASVVEMDDKPDEDREDEVQKVEPDFCFEVGPDESY
ncbi:hypothetical protein PC123_g11591 [Phytophthora cactorum]|nr:hypothetical protein PC123_g11591 [Phytophthora cactorum]